MIGHTPVMEFRDVTIRMPAEMASAIEGLARRQDVSPGQVVRNAIDRELRRTSKVAKTSDRTDERLVASLQSLLAQDIARARTWRELESRLADKGVQLRPAGGGVSLFDQAGRKLCKGSELGFPYRRLVRRFRCAMPGHPHGSLGLVLPEDPLIE